MTITDNLSPRCKHGAYSWRCLMPQCPDCDSVKMFCDPPQGDGRCSACHGMGTVRFFDSAALEMLYMEQPACEECFGTGKCQTCAGSGVVEVRELRIAA